MAVYNINKTKVCLHSSNTSGFQIERTFTKFGDLMFRPLFSKLLHSIKLSELDHCFDTFRSNRLVNKTTNSDLNFLFKLLPKFSCKLYF
jgi:hypothetical protein